MSTHHDEHGDVDVPERDHGPEWWAMAGEVCQCEHHVDEHHQFNLGTPRYFAGGCMAPDCVCSKFRPLDNQ